MNTFSFHPYLLLIGFKLYEDYTNDPDGGEPLSYKDRINYILELNKQKYNPVDVWTWLFAETDKKQQEYYTVLTAKKSLQLDTLALGVTTPQKTAYISPEYAKILQNRARAKYVTQQLSSALGRLGSPLNKGYWNSYYCANQITQKLKKFTSKYCKNRWCLVCNRVRTAKLMNGYMPQFEKFKEPVFLTLTQKNCNQDSIIDMLDAEAAFFSKYFTNRRQLYKRDKFCKFIGIKKVECTYNAQTQTYHPHYHLVVDGLESARHLLDAWLNHWLENDKFFGLQLSEYEKVNICGKVYPVYKGMSASPKAQDLKPATQDALKELFKYFTKLITRIDRNRAIIQKDAFGNDIVTGYKPLIINVLPLDVIFQSMKGRRVFQAINIKPISEDIEELQSEEDEMAQSLNTVWEWNTIKFDWYNYDGVALSDYQISRAIRSISFVS